jgi:signal transduction histidine kinase
MAIQTNSSIKRKLVVAIISSIFVSMVLSTIALIIYDRQTFKENLSKELEVLANITVQRSTAALAFRDKKTLKATAESLFLHQNLELACIYDRQKKLFVAGESKLQCPDSIPEPGITVNDSGIEIIKAYERNNVALGYFYLKSNLNELNQRSTQFLMVVSLIFFIASFSAYLLTRRLQQGLVKPIVELSNIAEKVASKHDYSLRSNHQADDETGTLSSTFNMMLSKIQLAQLQSEELVSELRAKSAEISNHANDVEKRNAVIKSSFASASHDLRQPLQAMTIFTESLKMQGSEKQKPIFEKLELAIDNMRQLFTELLDFSKLEARMKGISKNRVAIRPTLEKIIHEFDALASDKKLSLRFHIPDCEADSNALFLERIVRNLLSNAIRYTEKGGILCGVRRFKDRLSIEIWDTGIGIPEEKLPHIFDEFSQVEEDAEISSEGYGLGLSIVKRLASQLDHPISVASKVGKGTVFKITIPLTDEKPKPNSSSAKKTAAPKAPVSASPSLLSEHKVLLIDDDETIRNALASLLQTWNMPVIEADSLANLQDMLAEGLAFNPDIIVSDYQLSETDTGEQAIAMARSSLGEIPALIVTGTTDEELLKHIKSSGIPMLHKPVKPAKLRALINNLTR